MPVQDSSKSFHRHGPRFVDGAACVLALSLWAACSSDDATVVAMVVAPATPQINDPVAPPPDAEPPVYALMTQVYNIDDRSVYVLLTDTLDPTDLSLGSAREFPGVANLAAINGKLMVSSGEEPLVTAFDIGSDLSWSQTGEVSFQSYGVDSANFFGQFFLDENTMYLQMDYTKRILWNPTAMQIVGTREDSSLPFERNGLTLDGGGNRNSVTYDGGVLQAFFYHDKDWYDFGADSLIAKYDPVTHEETDILTAPCPGLAIATRDEQGNTYFSTWDYPPAPVLFGTGPAPCVVRVTPDEQLDASFTTDFTSWTGGRYSMNFRYVGNGRAVANVLHTELLDVDFAAPFTWDAVDAMWASGPHWKLWSFDLETQTAAPIEGIDAAIGSGAQFSVLDGRTFIFLPVDDYATTQVYELDQSGVARLHFEIAGDLFKWVRVR